MASCDVQTLIDNAACFECLSVGEKKTVELALLSRIVGITDVNVLVQYAKCVDCLNSNFKSTVEIQLLCEWLN